jgi:outer membrane protein TolC
MALKRCAILLLLVFMFTHFQVPQAVAQESILSDVSYLYLEKLVAAAKENYPRVKSLNSQVAIAKSNVSAAKISWLDPFSFQYVARSNETNTNVVNITTADVLTGYQFGVSFNPGSLFSKPSAVHKAKEQVKMALSDQAEYFLTLETMVKSRYILYLQYQRSLVPVNNAFNDAENNLKVIRNKYQKGEATFLEFNSASTAYSQAYQTKLQTEASYLTAKVSLEELTVKPLENIK